MMWLYLGPSYQAHGHLAPGRDTGRLRRDQPQPGAVFDHAIITVLLHRDKQHVVLFISRLLGDRTCSRADLRGVKGL